MKVPRSAARGELGRRVRLKPDSLHWCPPHSNGRLTMHIPTLFRTALAAVLACLLGASSAYATNQPDAAGAQTMLSAVQRDMVAALQDPAAHGDQTAIEKLVNRLLVPHVDLDRASILVLGDHWRNATPEQRARFVDEFRSFLVRFYSGALASYVKSNAVPADVIRFDRPPALQSETQALVHSVVRQDDGKTVPVEYRLYWSDGWRVIDVSVGGISIARNYRSQFASRVAQVGMDGLIAELAQRNGEQAAR